MRIYYYYLDTLDYYSHLQCYFHSVSVDVASDLLQTYLVELWNLSAEQGISLSNSVQIQ